MPALGLLLLTAGLVPPVVTYVVVHVVRAAALQSAFERVGPWAFLAPTWLLVLVVPVYVIGALGGARWWVIATAALLVLHVGAGRWVVVGLLRQQGVFRHLRPYVARSVAARADPSSGPPRRTPHAGPAHASSASGRR